MNLEELMKQAEQLWWLRFELWNNTVLRWLMALLVAVLAWSVLRLVMGLLRRRVRRFAEGTKTHWDDGIIATLNNTKGWFLLVVALYFASLVLIMPDQARNVVETVAVLALLLQAALWGNQFMMFAIEHGMRERRETDPAAATTISALSFVGKLVLWSVVLLLALDNMGIDVTALVAGLGVGGIAVALAAQNILGDLFASLSIVLDQPFVLGDFIIVGSEMGTVEKIGLKTTRVRSLSGEQLIFSNTDLLQSRIRNYKRMNERRIVFSVGVIYGTPKEKLAAMPDMIREVVEAQKDVRLDRAHFKSFGDFSLNYEVVYYMLVPDYNAYMDTQQAINLAIYERFAAEGIEFAYPTQTLFLEKTADGAA